MEDVRYTHMIPFIYKYKLKTLDEFDTEYTFDVNTHLLLLGGERTGKTTLSNLLVHKFITPTQENYLCINNIKEQGIQYYRTDMKYFCQTSPTIPKIVVVDEVDDLSDQVQQIFLNYMNKYGNSVKFILVGKSSQKIIEGMFQKCAVVIMKPIQDSYFRTLTYKIIKEEQIQITDDAVDYLIQISSKSVNTLLNYLEKYKIIGIPITKAYMESTHHNIHDQVFVKMTHAILKQDTPGAISEILYLYKEGYSVIDVLDSYFQFIKLYPMDDLYKYGFVKIICKYIIIYTNIHEHQLELLLFIHECIKMSSDCRSSCKTHR
jgi:DNA polymerase III delta prime subunit